MIYIVRSRVFVSQGETPLVFSRWCDDFVDDEAVSMMVVMFLMIMMRMIKILMLQISSADRLDIEEKTCLVEEVRRTLAASPQRSSSTRWPRTGGGSRSSVPPSFKHKRLSSGLWGKQKISHFLQVSTKLFSNYPYLALLHLNRLEVILNRRRQVWCYLLVNHNLESLSFVSILFQFYFYSISNLFLFNFYFIWTVLVLFLC